MIILYAVDYHEFIGLSCGMYPIWHTNCSEVMAECGAGKPAAAGIAEQVTAIHARIVAGVDIIGPAAERLTLPDHGTLNRSGGHLRLTVWDGAAWHLLTHWVQRRRDRQINATG